MWEAKSSGAVNVRKNEFIESINLRWKNRISARNAVYEIKKLQLLTIQHQGTVHKRKLHIMAVMQSFA